ncbi:MULTISPECIES: hypothetical protein [Sphingobacterium]|uniref:hypothetical protein n=1 Tax=Sphingobacterium TaxID=28453 RepID=UPI0025801E0F|nr:MULTISPECIES: hypothetical protein [Sphingobacterium]
MGRVKVADAIKINLIDEFIKEYEVSNRLIAVWADVNYSQVSSWRSNTSQPSEENLNQLGELFERENTLLRVTGQTRRNTGLAKALDQELKRLMKVEKIPFEIENNKEEKQGEHKSTSDSNEDSTQSKKSTKIINPLLVKKIKAFAEEYKKKNPPPSLTYFDKPFAELTKDELKGLNVFICNSTMNPGLVEMGYHVVTAEKEDLQLVASFVKFEDAKNYIDLIERGYIDLGGK